MTHGHSLLVARRRFVLRGRANRRGSFTAWLIIALPVMLIMVFGITAIGTLWLARAELSNLADAAALAGAKVWGDGPNNEANRTAAHLAAQAVAQANTVLGNALSVDANDDPLALPNSNLACPGTITLGRLDGTIFDAGQAPDAVNERACRVELTTAVTVPFFNSLGVLGPFHIAASAVAVYDPVEGAGTPRLRIITAANCP